MNYSSKIKRVSALTKIAYSLKKSGKTLVFTNGCFDLLHPGHTHLLQEAKKKGNVLIVGINSDRSIKKIKGSLRPILPQSARTRIVAALACVDYVVLFEERTPYTLIKRLKPHILIKGGDWDNNTIIGRTLVKKVVRIPLLKSYSSTAIINTICARYCYGT